MPEEHPAHTGSSGASAAAAEAAHLFVPWAAAGMPAAECGFSAAGLASPHPPAALSVATPPGDTPPATGAALPAKASSPSPLSVQTLTNGRLQHGVQSNSAASCPAGQAAPGSELGGVLPAGRLSSSSSSQGATAVVIAQVQLPSQPLAQKAILPPPRPHSAPSPSQQPRQKDQQQQPHSPAQTQPQMQAQGKCSSKSGVAQQRQSIIAAAAAAQRDADALLTRLSPRAQALAVSGGVHEAARAPTTGPAAAATQQPSPSAHQGVSPRGAQAAVPQEAAPDGSLQQQRPAKQQPAPAADAEGAEQRKKRRRRRHERGQGQAHHLDLVRRVATIAAEAQEIDSEVSGRPLCTFTPSGRAGRT